jgi:hypothetical protein
VPHLSWAECDLVVAVAAASMGLGVIVREQVRVGAAGAPAHQADAGAAGECYGHVVANIAPFAICSS